MHFYLECFVNTNWFIHIFSVCLLYHQNLHLCIVSNTIVHFQCFFPGSLTAIEDDYSGPKLTDGKVTPEFILQLMKYYRDQNKLHRKYAYQVRSGL